jgi:hypothetical protein
MSKKRKNTVTFMVSDVELQTINWLAAHLDRYRGDAVRHTVMKVAEQKRKLAAIEQKHQESA